MSEVTVGSAWYTCGSCASWMRTRRAMPTVTNPEPGVLRLEGPGDVAASVILLHGYAADATVNVSDGDAFLGPHTEVLLPDAPGHGARRDGTLERIAALEPDERTAAIVALAARWADELDGLAARCRERGARRVVLVGISMGGLAAFASLAQPCAFDAVAAVLAWPAAIDEGRITPGSPPLLIGVAGRDEAVPPAPARRFAAVYGAELHEYPESTHHMRPRDWRHLWAATAAFVRRSLRGSMPHRDA